MRVTAAATPIEPGPLSNPPRYDAQNRRLCGAKSQRTGELCNAPAMTGQRVCQMHGGSFSGAKSKARLRLAELVDPAIATLAREMATAQSSKDRMAAANSILDRAGWGRVTNVEIGDARELLVARLIALRDEIQQAAPPPTVIEGDVDAGQSEADTAAAPGA